MSVFSTSWQKWLTGIVILAIGSAVLFRPLTTAYHRHKEKHTLALAQHFFTTGDYRSATLAIRQILSLNSNNVEACQVMASIADLLQSPTTLDWRRRIVEIIPSPETKLQLAEAGLRYQSRPFPLTSQILTELTATATNLAFYHVVAAERALTLHQMDLAENELATAVKLNPTNRLYQLNLATVELNSQDNIKLDLARTQLKSFLTDSNLGPVALRTLIVDRLTHADTEMAHRYSQQLLESPQATLADRLQNLAILKKISAADFAAQLATVQATATNAPTVSQVASWMQGNNMSTNALAWLAKLPVNLRIQPAVQVAQAEILEALADWKSLRQLCNHGNWDELDFLRQAFLSRAWSQLGELAVARSNWHSAVDATDNRLGAFTGLLELTTHWNMNSEREDLLWLLLQKFPHERWVSATLEQQCCKTGDTPGLWRIYRQLSTVFPADPGFNNNYAYTSLLLHKDQIEADNLATRMHVQSPENPAIASTYAFALHLRGHNVEALAVMQKLDRALLEQPALALHYGILLAATGKNTEARHYLDLAHASADLLPEERHLLEKALADH